MFALINVEKMLNLGILAQPVQEIDGSKVTKRAERLFLLFVNKKEIHFAFFFKIKIDINMKLSECFNCLIKRNWQNSRQKKKKK